MSARVTGLSLGALLCLASYVSALDDDTSKLQAPRSNEPYYRLEWDSGELILFLEGVELRRYETESVELGTRVGRGSNGSIESLRAECQRNEVPEPKDMPPPGQRSDIVLGARDATAELPRSFRVTCAPELKLRFVRSAFGSLSDWWYDTWPRPEEPLDATRIRITLPDGEFAALYRAMPQQFLVLLPPR